MRTLVLALFLLAAGCAGPASEVEDPGEGDEATTGATTTQAPGFTITTPAPPDPAEWSECDPAADQGPSAVEVMFPSWPSFDEARARVQETLGTGPFEPMDRHEHDTWHRAGNVTMGVDGNGLRPKYVVVIGDEQAERPSATWARQSGDALADAFYPAGLQGAWVEGESYWNQSPSRDDKQWFPTHTLHQAGWYDAWPSLELVRVAVASQYGWMIVLTAPVALEGAPGAPLSPEEVRLRVHAFWTCMEPEAPEFQYDDLEAAMSLGWDFKEGVYEQSDTFPYVYAHWARPDRVYIQTPVVYMDPWNGHILWAGKPNV